jgi:hypothetical protein
MTSHLPLSNLWPIELLAWFPCNTCDEESKDYYLFLAVIGIPVSIRKFPNAKRTSEFFFFFDVTKV